MPASQQLNRSSVIWIDSNSSPDLEHVKDQLHDVDLRHVKEIGDIPVLLKAEHIQAAFLRLPSERCGIAEAIGLFHRHGIGVLVQDLGTTHTELFRSSGGEAYWILGDADPSRIASMLRAMIDARSGRQLTQLARRAAQTREPWREMLIGESEPMRQVASLVELVAPRRSTVLITGETGTGKEVVARAIHMASSRRDKPMVAVNCSALPEALLEAELFGHSKGAFTGAIGHRIGRFEQAHNSTIFLDEIGDMPLELQSKLLRVLQEREFQRLGSAETIRVDVRVIAATNVDLVAAVEKKKFREDLFYRLNVLPIHLPILRHRTGDIPLLAEHLLEKICEREKLSNKVLSAGVLDALEKYSWPGNIRQLEHAIETAVILSGEREILQPTDFTFPQEVKRVVQPELVAMPQEGLDFDEMMTNIQRYLLTQAIEKAGGNKARAAEMLRMKRSTLVSKIKTLSEQEDACLS